MNDFDPDQFEAELRTLRPAKPPTEVLDGIAEELMVRPWPTPSPGQGNHPGLDWQSLCRWLALATALTVAAAALLILPHPITPTRPVVRPLARAARPFLNADQVQIDRQLLAAFDAVARLPSGEPVRFHCRQWLDKVSLRDSAAGLVVEQRSPRLEIVPASFETY